jgi:hypothetical protein
MAGVDAALPTATQRAARLERFGRSLARKVIGRSGSR